MNKKRKFVVLMNPLSGTSDKKLIQNVKLRTFIKNEFEFSFEETNLAGNYQLLKEKFKPNKLPM